MPVSHVYQLYWINVRLYFSFLRGQLPVELISQAREISFFKSREEYFLIIFFF
jgi:hypothetical protein